MCWQGRVLVQHSVQKRGPRTQIPAQGSLVPWAPATQSSCPAAGWGSASFGAGLEPQGRHWTKHKSPAGTGGAASCSTTEVKWNQSPQCHRYIHLRSQKCRGKNNAGIKGEIWMTHFFFFFFFPNLKLASWSNWPFDPDMKLGGKRHDLQDFCKTVDLLQD